MTCIVGVVHDGRVFIGGDSAASAKEGHEIYVLETHKVFATGEYLVGFTQSYRIGQILQYHVEWPSPPERARDLTGFVVREIVTAARRAIAAEGAMRTVEGADRGAQFMLGFRGRLFSVAEDFSVGSLFEPYLAIGAGRVAAYGELQSTAGLGLPPEERVTRALAKAVQGTNCVREPFVILGAGLDGVPSAPSAEPAN